MTALNRQQSVLETGHAVGLRIWLLGAFRVVAGERAIEAGAWRLRKAGSLLKLLALSPGHRMHKEQLAEALWPGLDGRSGANNLHQALHFARHTLEPDLPHRAPSSYLGLRDDVLTLAGTGDLWIDVDAFETAAEGAHRGGAADAYEAALALYGGDLLPDDPYEEWTSGRRETLRGSYISLLWGLARLKQAQGDLAESEEILQRLLAHDPLHEEAHVELMRLFAAGGHPARALRQYESLTQSLQRELAVAPQPASQQVYREIQAGLTPGLSPEPAGLGEVRSPQRPQRRPAEERQAPASTLPVYLTSFVGRTKELAEISQALKEARLVTLAGPGGCGKTRLAVRVAGGLLNDFPDGVWVVDLAPLTNPALVARTVAGVLAVREESGRTLLETLTRTLVRKRLLLVLDNCEHLIEACAVLAAALLAAAPDARILATSRQPLRVAGEVIWRVPSLSFPRQEVAPSSEALQYDAVRLFADRARLNRPGFGLTDENVEAIVGLCRRLDGLPLAIELAAARINLLTPSQILERLHDPFQVLGVGPRSALERHETLRGAIDWSYRLLTIPEQRLFDTLSVFRGGWSLEAGEEVAAGAGIVPDDVLALLAQLVDGSMVMVDEAGDGSVRYRLLETLREYGWQRLTASEGYEEVRRRHAVFFLQLVRQAEAHFRGPEQGRWLDRLETEHDNLRMALDWLLEREGETALRMATDLEVFWRTRGHVTEGRTRLSGLLAKSPEAAPVVRAMALGTSGLLARLQGDYIGARTHLEEALAIFRRMGDYLRAGRTLKQLGTLAWHQGDLPRAQAVLDEALSLARDLDDRAGVAAVLNDVGVVSDLRGDDDRAERLYKESAALFREVGDEAGMAITLMNLGTLANEVGDNVTACRYYEESVSIYRRLGDQDQLASVLGNYGNALRDLGNVPAARRVYLESLELQRRGGDRRGMTFSHAGLGHIALMAGQYVEARRFFREATEIRIALDIKIELIKSVEAFAMLAFAQGEVERGVKLEAAAAGLRLKLGVPLEPHFRARLEKRLQRARETLGKDVFDAVWLPAQTIDWEEAVAYAMSTDDGTLKTHR